MNQKPITPKTKPKAHPAVRDLAPRTDAKGGNKSLGVASSSAAPGGLKGDKTLGVTQAGTGNGI